jgi:hypothetical protein
MAAIHPAGFPKTVVVLRKVAVDQEASVMCSERGLTMGRCFAIPGNTETLDKAKPPQHLLYPSVVKSAQREGNVLYSRCTFVAEPTQSGFFIATCVPFICGKAF